MPMLGRNLDNGIESKLEKFINHDSVCALPLSENERTLIRELLERHYEATGSARALELLMRFDDHAEQFRAIRPRHSAEVVLIAEVAAAAMSANSAPQLA